MFLKQSNLDYIRGWPDLPEPEMRIENGESRLESTETESPDSLSGASPRDQLIWNTVSPIQNFFKTAIQGSRLSVRR